MANNVRQKWKPPPVRHSQASIALGRILDIHDSPVTIALREAFSRSELCRLRNGQVEPRTTTSVMIEQITKGRVTPSMWGLQAKPTICQACGRP
jgi:hypothetical protein